MKTTQLFLVCMALCVGRTTAWPGPATPKVYDVGEDFSLFSNPNPPWSYRYLKTDANGAIRAFSLSDPYSFFSADGLPIEGWVIPGTTTGVFHNDSDETLVSIDGGVYPPGAVWLTRPPFGGFFGDQVRFEVPQDGHYVLSARFETVFKPSADAATVTIERNGALVFYDIFSFDLNPTPTSTFEQHLKLGRGEVFDFTLYGSDGGSHHDTLFEITFVLKHPDKMNGLR